MWLKSLCHFVVLIRLVGSFGSDGKSIAGALSSLTASAASGPSYFKGFAICSEMASILRLKVDAALAVPLLSKIICSSPCVGTANDGFFGVKERHGNRGPPLTFGFFSALAGLGVALRSLTDV